MDTKVSIITPCLNSEETIRDTIESVLGQSYQNIEYIIVDGRSTDRTIEIVKEYASGFEGRLRYISEKDSGIYDAMNKGILQASGSVIGIINSDDWYEPEAVEQAVQCVPSITFAYTFTVSPTRKSVISDFNCASSIALIISFIVRPPS